ncbi:MAG: hypothetical protein WC759_03575 [Candidatus Micrarchaeia archaeon]|jgi:hypothetical protein
MIGGKKKGQAAMEYLTTYGWAVLVILIVLAAFVWLGIFNPKTPEQCGIPGMRCDNAQLIPATGGQRLSLKLSNQLAERVQICSVHCSAGPLGSNGLPLRNGAATTSAKAGSTGCNSFGLMNTFIFNPATGIYELPSGTNVITIGIDAGPAVVVSGGSGQIVPGVPIGDGVVGPGANEPLGNGIVVPGVGVGQQEVAQPLGRKVAQLQGGIIADPGGVTVSDAVVIVVGPPSETPFLEIGQGKTFVSNTCLDSSGKLLALKSGEQYNGKVFVEYVLKNDPKNTPARVLEGDISTSLSAGASS